MLRIAITTQVYPPEPHPTAIMVRELAEHLVSRGWEVTVFCGLPNHPRGKLFPGWRWKVWQRFREKGVEVLRTGHLVRESRAIGVRAAVFTTQAAGAALAAALQPRVDVVLVYGPPLVGPGLGAAVAKRHRARLVNVVYDMYPDIAVETGKVTNPLVIGAARVAEKAQYLASDMTVVLSDGFKRTLMRKGVSADRIAVVPVWLDPDEIRPMDRNNAWRRENGIPLDKFVVLYAGTIGVISGAAIVAEAASLLKERNDVLILFVGEGEDKPVVEARARELGLSNVRFLPFQPRDRLCEVQATADMGLVTLAQGRGRTSVPSKVVGYMAAGRGIIASVDADSDTGQEVATADLGSVMPPGDARSLAKCIAVASQDRIRVQQCGVRARARFESTYTREAALNLYARRLEALVGS